MAKKPTGRKPAAQKPDYPRHEPSGWQVAPGTPFIPDDFWPFFSYGRKPNQAPWDDVAWAHDAAMFLEIYFDRSTSWNAPRTREMACWWSAVGEAIRYAITRVLAVAPLHLSPAECDIIERGDDALKAALAAYGETSTAIRLAGGETAPPGSDLTDQWAKVDTQRDNPRLARALLAAVEANPFRANLALEAMRRVLHRLQVKLLAEHKAAQESRTSASDSPQAARPPAGGLTTNASPLFLQPPAGQKPLPGGNEQPWMEAAPGYVPLAAAMKHASAGFSDKAFGRLLTPTGPCRYMRRRFKGGRGGRCKVNLEDALSLFRWLKQQRKNGSKNAAATVPYEQMPELIARYEEEKQARTAAVREQNTVRMRDR